MDVTSQTKPVGAKARSLTELPIALPDDLFFTPPEIARLLKMSRAKAYELVKSGQLRGFYVGTQPRVTRQDLEEFIRAKFQ
jgi:excisionase family DNA binding protein